MATSTAETVICGAGIAGIAAAYYLAVTQGMADVVLVEQGAPLSLTSDKSTECYRDWWPGPGDAMVALMSRSIDLLEQIAHETGNRIQMNRRGYLYATADPARIPLLRQAAEEAAAHGTGPLCVHGPTADHGSQSSYLPAPAHGFEGQPDGADLILDPALIGEHFPYLTERAVAVLHARRCGWLSAQQLGMYLLERARERGLRLLRSRVEGIDLRGGAVAAVRTARGTIETESIVDAAGPYAGAVARFMGVDLPLHNELHAKVAFRDVAAVVPRGAPFLVWDDAQRLYFSNEDRVTVARERAELLERTFPAGVHLRPEGGPQSDALLLIWGYDESPTDPAWPPSFDPAYAEICLRGLARMIPALRSYIGHAPRPVIDGGYYTKTPENRPLIGPLAARGAFACCAFGGFGIMAACGAAELLADHICATRLPPHAAAFAPA
ncbi:MAG TPA: FAD-dependent oxidoreductase, partial [Roseiflexaceae bacterium]